MSDSKRGVRVRLIRIRDLYTELKPGDEGTIVASDDLGTVFVKWDSGSSLGLLPDHDEWEELS